MPFDTTILADKIEGFKAAYESGQFSGALLTALNEGNGLMQQRIFTQNEDTQGQSFGTYKKGTVKGTKSVGKGGPMDFVFTYHLSPHEKKRVKHGRQILKKDLELFGSLRKAIETVIESETAAVLEFNNEKSAKIAQGQANQIDNIRNGRKGNTKGFGATKIFRLNASEKEQVTEQGLLLINQILKP